MGEFLKEPDILQKCRSALPRSHRVLVIDNGSTGSVSQLLLHFFLLSLLPKSLNFKKRTSKFFFSLPSVDPAPQTLLYFGTRHQAGVDRNLMSPLGRPSRPVTMIHPLSFSNLEWFRLIFQKILLHFLPMSPRLGGLSGVAGKFLPALLTVSVILQSGTRYPKLGFSVDFP